MYHFFVWCHIVQDQGVEVMVGREPPHLQIFPQFPKPTNGSWRDSWGKVTNANQIILCFKGLIQGDSRVIHKYPILPSNVYFSFILVQKVIINGKMKLFTSMKMDEMCNLWI